MCDYDDGMRERKPHRVYVSYLDKSVMWIQPVYMHVLQSDLGTIIAAKINFHDAWNGGDYAAYMGAFPGEFDHEVGALCVIRHGIKIDMRLAETLFRDTIAREYPGKPIHWRR